MVSLLYPPKLVVFDTSTTGQNQKLAQVQLASVIYNWSPSSSFNEPICGYLLIATVSNKCSSVSACVHVIPYFDSSAKTIA